MRLMTTGEILGKAMHSGKSYGNLHDNKTKRNKFTRIENLQLKEKIKHSSQICKEISKLQSATSARKRSKEGESLS